MENPKAKKIVSKISFSGANNLELLIYLIIPLTILTIIFATVSFFFGDSFFTNLTTEFISIVITVSYVNWVFNIHKVKKWEETDRRISGRLRIIINTYITALRSSFSLDFVSFNKKEEDEYLMNYYSLNIAKEVLEPIILEKLLYLNGDKWKSLIYEFKEILEQIDRIFLFYGNKLSPKKYSLC